MDMAIFWGNSTVNQWILAYLQIKCQMRMAVGKTRMKIDGDSQGLTSPLSYMF